MCRVMYTLRQIGQINQALAELRNGLCTCRYVITIYRTSHIRYSCSGKKKWAAHAQEICSQNSVKCARGYYLGGSILGRSIGYVAGSVIVSLRVICSESKSDHHHVILHPAILHHIILSITLYTVRVPEHPLRETRYFTFYPIAPESIRKLLD